MRCPNLAELAPKLAVALSFWAESELSFGFSLRARAVLALCFLCDVGDVYAFQAVARAI